MSTSQGKLTSAIAEISLPRLRVSYVSVLLASVFLLGLGLRLNCLDCNSLWFDELASIEVAQRGLLAIFTDRFGWMHVEPVLHYLIVWLTIQPLDPTASAVLVRLPSALAGSLTVLLVYGIGKELFGRVQGLIAASLLALSAIHLEYSQDVRPYSMLVFLTLLSVYCLLRAEGSGSARWWVAFVISMAANMLNAYVALTLVLPSLVPYIIWLLWRYRKRSRGHDTRTLIYMVGAFVVIGLVAVGVFIDMAAVPRALPDLRLLDPVSLLMSPVELVTWFTQLSFVGPAERLLELCFFLLAVGGLLTGIYKVNYPGTSICAMFIVVPASLLAILSTTNSVFQQYSIFSMPFYFLLISNGIAFIMSAASASLRDKLPSRGETGVWLALPVAAVLIFAVSLYGQEISAHRQVAILHPDLRGAAAYLARVARSEDTIVFIGWGDIVANAYWKANPPAPFYSGQDPTLFEHPVAGKIYWVIGYSDVAPPEMVHDAHWVVAANFDRALILRDDDPGADIALEMNRLLAQLAGAAPHDVFISRAVNVLRGCVYQAEGKAAMAADAYTKAGPYFLIGSEYLLTSKGFTERGDHDRAWRDALVAKSMEPEDPRIHEWLAEMLLQRGDTAGSRLESEVADALRADP